MPTYNKHEENVGDQWKIIIILAKTLIWEQRWARIKCKQRSIVTNSYFRFTCQPTTLFVRMQQSIKNALMHHERIVSCLAMPDGRNEYEYTGAEAPINSKNHLKTKSLTWKLRYSALSRRNEMYQPRAWAASIPLLPPYCKGPPLVRLNFAISGWKMETSGLLKVPHSLLKHTTISNEDWRFVRVSVMSLGSKISGVDLPQGEGEGKGLWYWWQLNWF